jgi:chemotaxis protein methyltransferase CheR
MLDDKILGETSLWISKLLGLHYPKSRWKDLERGLISAAKELGLGSDFEDINRWLEGGNFTTLELDTLTNYLTVGETYFFRDKALLETFQKQIIPEIVVEQYGKNQSLKIWSAGCCTGEEPYTLAMILLETIPEIRNWNISIIATDINRTYLEKARNGVYSNWSFRDTPAHIKSRYFSKVKAGWQIAPEVMNMVQFAHLNLAENQYPALQLQLSLADIIFCRNVLMYFSNELIKSIGQKFYEALNPRGWFITSPVELSDENFQLFNKIQYDKSIVYRKTEKRNTLITSSLNNIPNKIPPVKNKLTTKPTIEKTVQKVQPKNAPVKEPKLENLLHIAETYYQKKQYQACADFCSTIPKLTEVEKPMMELWVKSLANLGRYDEAIKKGTELLKLNNLNAGLYYIVATILVETKEFTEAELMVKRALYLDPSHILSHLLLGNIYQNTNNSDGVQKHFGNVRKLLANIDENSILENAGGLTAGSILLLAGSSK